MGKCMERKFKIIILLLLGFILVLMAYSYSQLPFIPPDYPTGPNFNSSDRVLVIAPHPDDEVICNAGIVRYAVENNIPIKIVILTDGCSLSDMSVERHQESLKGLSIIGLCEDKVSYLGFRDGSLNDLLTNNWEDKKPFKTSNGSTNVTYPFASQKNGAYSGQNLQKNLETIMTDFKPTVIIYPSGDDEQLDHWASSAFTEYTALKTNFTGKKYTYLLHLPPQWPNPRTYNPEYYLYPPASQLGLQNGPKWVVFPLGIYQERLKEEAINTHRSQLDLSSYLLSFIRKNELFSEYPELNISPKNDNESVDYTDGDVLPPLIFEEPLGDRKDYGCTEQSDIKGLGIEISPENTWVSMETVGNPSAHLEYVIELFVYKYGIIERMKVKVINDSANLETRMPDGTIQSEKIPLSVKNQGFVVKIPTSYLNGSKSLIISGISYDRPKMIDQTAWRVLRIQN